MDGGTEEEYAFVCPECGESLEVNGSMRDALLERGCVICGASLTANAFSKRTSTDSR